MSAAVTFAKQRSTRYHAVLERPDGLAVTFEGGSYNKLPEPVPHDVAHLIVEDELALTAGVWGVLVAGGLFGHASVVRGRQRPHAAARGRAIVAAARETVMQAELLTRAVCDAAAGVTPQWSRPVEPAVLGRCHARLREAAAEWAALPAGGTLTCDWPHPVDRALAAVRPVPSRRS